MKIHHIGYAVFDIEKSSEELKKIGFYEETDTFVDERRNVLIKFMKKDDLMIELISPIKGRKSPVDNLLSKVGPTLYHICYEVEDIEKSVSELEKYGYMMIEKPDKAIAFGGRKVAFLYNRYIGIIELVEME